MLDQFDEEIDSLDRSHGLVFGIENKLQTKRKGKNVDLARALLQLLAAGVTGTVNLTNAGACSRAELARFIIAAGGSQTKVVEARQADFSVPARRPEYSELALERLRGLGINMRPWREALAELLARPGAAKEGKP